MSVREIRLSAGYCCKLACFCAEVNNVATAEQCAAIQERVATLSPTICAAAAAAAIHNSSSSLCPAASRTATLCNGGASCCTNSCNKPCTSKPDVCACPCNHCSTCSCCKHVKNRHCRLRCRPCDKVSMTLDFQEQLGEPRSVNFSRNFSFNSTEAQYFYDQYSGMPSIIAFYKPDDLTIVHVMPVFNVSYQDDMFLGRTEDYPVGRMNWVRFGAATAFPIFTVSVILTGLLIALLLQRTRRADQRPFRIAWSVNRGLWMGIIWPLIIMLLILQVSYVYVIPVPIARPALSILFPQLLACIGWLPLLLLWLYHIMHPQL